MKRIFAFVFLPVVLFALEPVNLIKDAGFEKDSELWLMRSEAEGQYDSTIINRHDPDSACIGNYCGSIDGRKKPAPSLPELYYVVGYLYQIIIHPKKLKDLDSLNLFHMALFYVPGSKSSAREYGVSLYFTRPSDGVRIQARYFWLPPGATPAPDTPTEKRFPDTIPDEGVWCSLKRDLEDDLIGEKGLSDDIELDTFLLFGYGVNHYVWGSQKAFFDGVRLTGYADYDVGIKEILSGDSVWENTSYTPEARIKNFGRENAPEFSVIAEIWEGETRVYYDSLPWSLTSDTEDTVSFADFTPTNAANHTLIVRTVMEPDESDEDDELSKTLFGTAVAEKLGPQDIILEVRSLTHPLRVSYSLPYTESGTLTLYDATGRRIERVSIQGSGKVEFGSALPSGIYIVRLESGHGSISRKAVVLK
jgi:hypothetical protein